MLEKRKDILRLNQNEFVLIDIYDQFNKSLYSIVKKRKIKEEFEKMKL
jgi:hypothetical protein